MFRMESQIAQTEYAVYVAKVNRPATEGATAPVPNIIDRAVAALRNLIRPIDYKKAGIVITQGAMSAK